MTTSSCHPSQNVRTLFIGLDGATFGVLDHLTRDEPEQGVVMPFLKRLIEKGFRAPLRSTAHPLTPPAWVSLMTGRTPGYHGVHDFVRFEDRSEEVYFTLYDFRDIRAETIWSLLGRQGRRLVSLNFPMMAPPEPVNGSLIPGFVSWKHLRRNVRPEGLYDRIKNLPGFNPRKVAWDFQEEAKIGEEMAPDEVAAWVRYHIEREEQWFRIGEMLLRDDKPDLFAIMFDGTDKIQHQAWPYLEPTLMPERPDRDYLRIRGLVLTYFRKLDGYIEQLVQAAGPGVQVFLASDHGFTTSDEVVRINRYLGELGYLTWRDAGDSESEQRRSDANFAYLNWQKTLAFCPTPSSNGICIRVARQPGAPGVPPEEFESFRARLIADLRMLKSAVTGEPVIRDVLLREQAFPGAAPGDAPDLTLVLRDYGFVSVRDRSPAVERRTTPMGTHHPDGIFVAAGQGIENTRADTMSILDVPSVLVHSVGLPVPENFEGCVPESLLTFEHLAQCPVIAGPPAGCSASRPTRSSDEDEVPEEDREKILDQLRALGYLED
jgi:predicted AlkP superfamily phosphohydrolase/phosphomutase